MNAALYRKYIREALALASPYPVPDKALQDNVATLAGGPFDLSAYRRGMEWNLAKDYIRSRTNEDTDQVEWKLTALGEAKENL